MKPRRTKPTIADVAPFPNLLDEVDRHDEQRMDIPDNLDRIKGYSIRLLNDPVFVNGEEDGDALPHFVLMDCRTALRCIDVLEKCVEKASAGTCEPLDITDACEAAFYLGACDQRMMNRIIYDKHIRAGRRQVQSLSRGPRKKSQDAQREYAKINQAVADRIKKRGRRKQPSLTEIRRKVADEMGVSYQKVRDAQKGGRK